MQLAFGVIHLHSIVNGLSCHMDWDAYGDLELYLLVFLENLELQCELTYTTRLYRVRIHVVSVLLQPPLCIQHLQRKH